MAESKAPGKKVGKAPPSQKSSVLSLAKAFRVLEAIAAVDSELTLSEIAAAAKLDPGTTHRMLSTLAGLGYIERSDGRRFALTLKILDLGFHAIGRRDLRTLARPRLRALVGEVSEAASVGVLEGGNVLYVERMRAGLTRLGVDIRVGTLIPAASSVIGWAILAFLPPDRRKLVLAEIPRQAFHSDGLPPAQLSEKLRLTRANGYALDVSQISGGLVALAVPIRDKDGFPVAAISVAAPTIRTSLDDLRARALAPILDAAAQIARGIEANGGMAY